MERSANKDKILEMSDDSDSESDDDVSPKLASSAGSKVSKQSISDTLTKIRINRNIAIKKG